MRSVRTVLLLPRRLNEADIPLLSASLAFSTLLALVPFFAVGFAVLHFFTGLDSIGLKISSYVFSFVDETAGIDVSGMLTKTLTRLSRASWTATSAVALVVTSLRLFLNLELAINRIWNSRNERPFYRRLILVGVFYFTIPIGLSLYGGLRSADLMKPFFAWNPALFDVGVMFFVLVMLNRAFPAPKVLWRTAMAGALISAVGLVALSESFSWLTKKVFNYSKFYGSLAALPLICLLVLLTWEIILSGVAFAAALQAPTGRKTRS